MTNKPISEPEMKFGLNKNTFTWPEINLEVIADRITDDGKAELYFYHQNGKGKILMHMGQANLLSSTMYRDFGKALETRGLENVDWQTVLTYVSKNTMQKLRSGADLLDMDQPPAFDYINYVISPIIPFNQPTTIYAPGGSGKSIFCDYISVLAQYGIAADHLPFKAIGQYNVLYLDWESTIDEHRRYVQAIKRGLNIKEKDQIRYQPCEYPLSQIVDNVRQQIYDNNIGLVIVDSQMAATAGYSHSMTEAQVSSQYYNDLRSFECATLTIDHVTKQSLSDGGADMPYGSVVKYNRSRSQFEFRKQQEAEDEFIEIALVHKKFNLGKLLAPIGIRINFDNTDNHLQSITFENCNIALNPKLSKVLSVRMRLINYLRDYGPATDAELAEAIDAQHGSTVTELNRRKNDFIKLPGGKWGLLQRDSN